MARKNKKQNEQLIMDGVPHEKVEPISREKDSKKFEVEEKVIEGQVSIFDEEIGETMIDETLAKEKLREAMEAEKPKKKRKSLITNLIFLAINLAVLGYIVSTCLGELKGMSIGEIIASKGNQLWWLLGGFVLFILIYLADSMMFYCLIKKSTGKKRFWLSYKVSSVGKYFDAITPFSVGGQPSQILNLTRAGVSPGIATSIPVIKLIIYNIVYTLTILCFLIFGIPFLPVGTAFGNFLFVFLKILAYIGVFFTGMVSVVFILVGSGKIIGRSAVRWIVRLGYKLKLVKDYRKTYNKIMGQVLEYQSSMQYLRKNKKTLFASVFFGLIAVLAYFAIPFVVVMAFSSSPITSFGAGVSVLFVCIVKSMICQMASVIIPLPGGTGMMEISFAVLFGVKSMLGEYFALGLLVWRLFNYYLTVIQGFTVSTVDSIVRMSKAKKAMKLEQVSSVNVNENINIEENKE